MCTYKQCTISNMCYYVQEIDHRDHQLHQLQVEGEETKHEKKQLSITASDMEREINRLKKVS